MFCFKCGFEIPFEAEFCSRCGTAQNKNSEAIMSNVSVSVNNDYSKDALSIYLTDVLNLELINSRLNEAWNLKNDEIKNMQDWNYYKNYKIKGLDISGFHFFYNGTNYLTLYRRCYSFDVINVKSFTGNWYTIDSKAERYLKKSSAYNDGSTGFFDRAIISDAFKRCFDDFKKTAPKLYEDKLMEISKESEKLEEINKEREKAKSLLEKAYSINIIPQQFRNLYTVYYLRDFISTSNETFSTALLHCDLDKIKQKLDTIIEQQQEIIVNQAILQAQNEKIMKQNQQTLNHLASIECNTDRAAQYAQIAANNAEACAWISVANYIKD